jgi:2-C-methyl-D-erythritol 4-phosphate cytidylyltransferase
VKTVAIIPAAGAGARMGVDRAKQYLDLHGKPLLAVTLEKFQICAAIQGIILVVPRDQVEYCTKEIIEPHHLTKVEKVVEGGERRQDSVRFGIEASEGRYELILIHDGVRPFIDPGLIEKVVAAGEKNRAVITALPVKETVKEVDVEGWVIKTCDRGRLRMVQTPQIFRYEDILEAHRRALREGWEAVTDDALLVEKMGIPVSVIEGSETNIKITTPHDMVLARRYGAENNEDTMSGQ